MRTITVGADYFPPYQYVDPSGELLGSDYDLMKSVLSHLNSKLSFIIDDWSLIEKSFHNKEIDILFQVQKTEAREASYYFSKKLRDAKTGIATNDKSEIDEYFCMDAFLQRKEHFGVLKGYQYGALIDNVESSLKMEYNNNIDLLRCLGNATIKYAVFDCGVFDYLNKNKRVKDTYMLNNVEFVRPLYVMFHSKALRDQFNEAFEKCHF